VPFVALTLLFIATCGVCGVLGGCQGTISESSQATREAEIFLTEAYGAEVRDAIENVKAKWSSLEAYNNPSIQSELATEQYVSHNGYASLGEAIYNWTSWYVVKSVTVTRVRVLEYSPERFKAVACITELVDKTTTEGVFIESLLPQEYQSVYVFVHEDDTWKLAGGFNISLPNVWRDWEYASDWLKETIGELPDWEPCNR
jgi:hypothetical protein